MGGACDSCPSPFLDVSSHMHNYCHKVRFNTYWCWLKCSFCSPTGGAVIKFVRASSLNSSQECEEPATASLGGGSCHLVTSTDSGIIRDIGTRDQPSLTRRAGQRRRITKSDRMALMMESLEELHATPGAPLPKDERPFTARIVVMGDDSTVGRLAKAYHSLRCLQSLHFSTFTYILCQYALTTQTNSFQHILGLIFCPVVYVNRKRTKGILRNILPFFKEFCHEFVGSGRQDICI